MEVIVPQKDLLRILACHDVANERGPMPVLANVLLTADAGKLVAQATDLYLAMRDEANAQVVSAGTIALPGKDLYERVKHLAPGDVQLRVDGTKAVLRGIGTKRFYELQGIPGRDFPVLPQSGDGPSWEVSSDVLRALFAATHFSIGEVGKQGRDFALFEIDGDKIRMVSTDGHRLSKMEICGTSAPRLELLIPFGSISTLRKFVEVKGASVKIQQDGPCAFFSSGTAVLSTKTIEGGFGDYECAIPKSQAREVQCSRHILVDALKAVHAATGSRPGILLRFGDSSLQLVSNTPGTGAGGDEIDVSPPGIETRVGMNEKYLLDALGAVTAAEVTLGVEDHLHPLTVRADGFVGVVMAMDLNP